MKKGARLVFIPSPGVGHLVSTIEFARLLINHDDRLWITVLVMKLSPLDTSIDTHSLSSQRLQVINLPECPSNSSVIMALLEQQKPLVKQAVSNLISESGPPVAAFVVDMFCTTMIDVAKQLGVPSLVFFTSGLAFLGLMLHLHSLREQEQDNTHFETQTLTIPSFATPVPPTALPSIVLNKEWDPVFLAFGRGLKKADAIIVNSFQELESHALTSFSQFQPIYPVGPIISPNANTDDVLNWLHSQPPSSVLFLCFGSMGSFTQDQVTEIARALENTGVRFLWSLRKPPPSPMTSPSDYSPSDLLEILPQGFLDRTAGIGKIIGWAPQAQILAHPATRAFVSHCGWNSILESIYFGVPIATWPLYAEQQTNAFLLVRELKMAVEIALDYRVDFKLGPNTLLTADKIQRGIRSVMDIDEDTLNRVKEMSQNSKNASLEGGSSYSYLGRFMDYIMNQVSI